MNKLYVLMATVCAVCHCSFGDMVPMALESLEIGDFAGDDAPEVIDSHMQVSLTCWACWTNLTDAVDVTRAASWRILGGEGFVTNIAEGVLYLDEEAINRKGDVVPFQIVVAYGGQTIIHEMEVVPTDSDELSFLTIVGSDCLGAHMVGQYYCEADWFSAGREIALSKDVRWSFDGGATQIVGVATLTQDGVLAPSEELDVETNVVVFATYRGIPDVVGEFEVVLTPETELEPVQIGFDGPDRLSVGDSGRYQATVLWSNWSEETLTSGDPRLKWTLSPATGTGATIDSKTGILTVQDGLSTTGQVWVCAEFAQGAWKVSYSNEVVLLPTPTTLSRIDINGPANVLAVSGESAVFSAYGFWTDDTLRACTDDADWTVDQSSLVSVVLGKLTVLKTLTERRTISLTAKCEGKSTTVNVTLIPESARQLKGLTIVGRGEAYAGAPVQNSCLATFSDYAAEDYTKNVEWSLAGDVSQFASVDANGLLTPKAVIPYETNVWLLATCLDQSGAFVTSNEVSILKTSIEIVGPEEINILDRGQYRCAEVRSTSVSILIKNSEASITWGSDRPDVAKPEVSEGVATLVPNRRAVIDPDEGSEVVLTVDYKGMSAEASVLITAGRDPQANPDVPEMVVTGFDDDDFDEAAASKKIVAFAMRTIWDSEEDKIGKAVLCARVEGTYNAKKQTLTATVTPAVGKALQFAAGTMTVANGVATGSLPCKKDSSAGLAVRITPEQVDGTLKIDGEEFAIRGGWDVFSNRRNLEAQDVIADYDGIYNIALPITASEANEEAEISDACPAVGGYLSVTVNKKNGKGKVAGVLGDGTKVSATVPVCTLGGIKEAGTNSVCMPIIIPLNSKTGAFTGVLWLHRNGNDVIADFNSSCCAWYAYWLNTGKKIRVSEDHTYAYPCEYEAWMSGTGGKFDAGEIPECLMVTNLFDELFVPEYYVKSQGDYETLSFVEEAYPVGFGYTFLNGKLVAKEKATKPVKYKEDGSVWYEYNGPTDSTLKLSLNKKSGVLTGSFALWYDGEIGENSKFMHKSLSAKSYGAWVPGVGGWFFGVAAENDPDRKAYALKRCIPFALVEE